jgi:uridine nucleosidase
MTGRETVPIWLDCDPGHDDAFALLLTCHLPYFNLIGVSTVYGNSSLDNTTQNALSMLTAFKRTDIKVYAGADKPLEKELSVASNIHGVSGLNGTSLLPEPITRAFPPDTAVFAMKGAIEKFPGKIAIVATGTLTNVAKLVLEHPNVLPKIRQISIMGGSFKLGNTTEWAEFNIWCDPEAAEIVLRNDILKAKTTLVPLNLTHRAIATNEFLEKIRHSDSSTQLDQQLRQLLYELLTFFASTYKSQFGFETGPPIHDPLAVIALLEFYKDLQFSEPVPDIDLDYTRNDIEVTIDGQKRGMLSATRDETGVAVATSMNLPAFWQLILQAINNCESTATKN